MFRRKPSWQTRNNSLINKGFVVLFNNRRFPYPAAFSQSTNQRCNAGSFIAGFSVSTHNLNFDYTKLPEIIQETMNPGMKVKHIKYTNISLNAGYAYNWVFARNCLACLSFNPAVAYKTSRIEKTEEREADDWYKNFNIDFILRAGVVYNNSKYFVGTSFVGRTYDYYKNSFPVTIQQNFIPENAPLRIVPSPFG